MLSENLNFMWFIIFLNEGEVVKKVKISKKVTHCVENLKVDVFSKADFGVTSSDSSQILVLLSQ